MPAQQNGQTQRFAPCPGLAALPNLAARLHENALPITRDVTTELGTVLTAPGSSWSFLLSLAVSPFLDSLESIREA